MNWLSWRIIARLWGPVRWSTWRCLDCAALARHCCSRSSCAALWMNFQVWHPSIWILPRWPAHWFGVSDPILLPKFDQVNEYLSLDGQVQIDAVGQVPGGVKWIVEVKWRSKRVGQKEMERFLARAQAES